MIDKVWMGTDHWIHSFPPWMPPEENSMDSDDLPPFVQQIPPPWHNDGKILTSNSNQSLDCNPRFKTEICRNFKEENPMDNDDLLPFLQQIPTAWQNTGKILTSNSNRSLDCNPRFKTEICRNFKERNKCIYGDRCQFAHGKKELRDVVRNSKYKTKLCQKYWNSGYCAYGPRCNFLHDEATNEELEMTNNHQPSTNNNHVEEFMMNVIPEVEEPMEQNMENIVPEILEPMEEKEDKENTNRPRTTTPTNIMDVNHLVFGSSFNESVTPMTTEEAMAQFQHYL